MFSKCWKSLVMAHYINIYFSGLTYYNRIIFYYKFITFAKYDWWHYSVESTVDKILLSINAHNVIKKLREPWVLWQLYCKREECFVMLNMESFPCKHDNMLLVDIKTNFIHLGWKWMFDLLMDFVKNFKHCALRQRIR